MEVDDLDDEEFAFSRNYFLAKELGGSKKKSSGKLADIDVVDEQVRNQVKILWFFFSLMKMI